MLNLPYLTALFEDFCVLRGGQPRGTVRPTSPGGTPKIIPNPQNRFRIGLWASSFFRSSLDVVWGDFGLLFEVQNWSGIVKNYSRNALWFPASFRERFLEISAQFPRPPDLKRRAPVYTGTRFSKNRRFRSRTSFWNDLS